MAGRRVFVTGLGIVSPCGNQVDEAFEAVYRATPSCERVDGDPDDVGRNDAILAPVRFDPEGVIPRIKARVMARASQMAVLAAKDAVAAVSQTREASNRHALGVYIGCSLGGSETIEDTYGRFALNRRMRPASVPLIMPSGPAAHISMHFGLKGPSLTYSIACISSAVAIGEATRAIRHGYVEGALAGGSEAQLNPATVEGWRVMGALASEHPDGPGASSRPFDRDRSGLVMGEGAAVLLLESEEAVSDRGGTAIAEVVGFGMSSDAHNLTEPHLDGQVAAMKQALADADVGPTDIGYVNAHATATVAGDIVEAQAIREVFGEHCADLPVSSTKGVHGHLIGAAGAMEAVWTIKALQTGRIPPTANLTDQDPACDLDCVPLVGREAPGLEYALSNSFAFGGSNAALVFKRV